MKDEKTIQVLVGPTSSPSAREARQKFASNLTKKGGRSSPDVYLFETNDQKNAVSLLQFLSRVRKIKVVCEGKQMTSTAFLHKLYLAEQKHKEQAFWNAYENAGRSWPPPEKEFLDLALACGDGWDGVEPGRPLKPEDRQSLLKVFSGRGFHPAGILERALELLPDDGSPLDSYSWKVQTANALGTHQYRIDDMLDNVCSIYINRNYWEIARNENKLVFITITDSSPAIAKRLYLERDGRTPRLFIADELQASGSNAGLDLGDWLPTVPPLHLSCRCMLQIWTNLLLGKSEFAKGVVPRITRLPSLQTEPLLT